MGLKRFTWWVLLATVVLSAVVVPVAAAGIVGVHSQLGARLAGMGQHGVVNFQSDAKQGKLCWSFDLPTTKGITGASIHQGAKGVVVIKLGRTYLAKGCVPAAEMALQHLEASPGSYSVWVDTKGHPGDLRGKLVVGTIQM